MQSFCVVRSVSLGLFPFLALLLLPFVVLRVGLGTGGIQPWWVPGTQLCVLHRQTASPGPHHEAVAVRQGRYTTGKEGLSSACVGVQIPSESLEWLPLLLYMGYLWVSSCSLRLKLT